jgi:hypothetical protein
MARQVKGVLFLTYVRMVRGNKDLPWAAQLLPEDRPYLQQRIDESAWYPMGTFERLGLAILRLVAKGNLTLVRSWGRLSAVEMAGSFDGLVVARDPRETLMRIQVVRRSLFDFETVRVLEIDDTAAMLEMGYGMSAAAEEAAAMQALGFFEGLVELSDGRVTEAALVERAWAGEPRTVLRLAWDLPGADRA